MACCGVTSPCGATGPWPPRCRSGGPRSSRNGGHRTPCCPAHAHAELDAPPQGVQLHPVHPVRSDHGGVLRACPMWATSASPRLPGHPHPFQMQTSPPAPPVLTRTTDSEAPTLRLKSGPYREAPRHRKGNRVQLDAEVVGPLGPLLQAAIHRCGHGIQTVVEVGDVIGPPLAWATTPARAGTVHPATTSRTFPEFRRAHRPTATDRGAWPCAVADPKHRQHQWTGASPGHQGDRLHPLIRIRHQNHQAGRIPTHIQDRIEVPPSTVIVSLPAMQPAKCMDSTGTKADCGACAAWSAARRAEISRCVSPHNPPPAGKVRGKRSQRRGLVGRFGLLRRSPRHGRQARLFRRTVGGDVHRAIPPTSSISAFGGSGPPLHDGRFRGIQRPFGGGHRVHVGGTRLQIRCGMRT